MTGAWREYLVAPAAALFVGVVLLTFLQVLPGSDSDERDDPRDSPSLEPADDAAVAVEQGERAATIDEADGTPGEAERYLAAIAARDAGDTAGAIEQFSALFESDADIAPLAGLRLAQALAAAGDRAEAVAVFEWLVYAESLPGSLQFIAMREAAGNLARLDRVPEALAVLDRADSMPGVTDGQWAALRWRAALMQRDAGDETWTATALEVMRRAPASPEALDAIETLAAVSLRPPHVVAGEVNYRFERTAAARDHFRAALADDSLDASTHAAAWFYLGALAEQADEPQEAIDAYRRSLDLAPQGELADGAHYWRARIFEEHDHPERAMREYDRIAEGFPDSSFAAEARRRAALARGFNGDVASALTRLEAIAADGEPAEAAEAARWHTIFRESRSQEIGERDVEVALDPADFHPAALWTLLDGDPVAPLPRGALDEWPSEWSPPSERERDAIAEWLDSHHGPPTAWSGAADAARVALAIDRLGDRSFARTLLFDWISHHSEAPEHLVDLAIAAKRQGLYDISMHAASRALSTGPPVERVEAPRVLLQLAYPAPYLDELTSAVGESPVPPLLLLALVRQESSFNPDAVSHAGARGLAQVMPATGEGIAQSLGDPWDLANLDDPLTSFRYGAYFLELQLNQFGGNLLTTLAAYNGGGVNAQRWLDGQPFDGPDGYIHGVDFRETRSYFRHVLENYAWYRFTYADATAPSIR